MQAVRGVRAVLPVLLMGALTVGALTTSPVLAQSALAAPEPTSTRTAPDYATSDGPVGPQVVNGRLGDPRKFPALVAIADRERYRYSGLYAAQVCGGTAVTTRLIITAAHCVLGGGRTFSADEVVVAHTPSGSLTDPAADVVSVRAITVNPDYDRVTQAGDIAVLRLRRPLEGIAPLLPALPAEDALFAPSGTKVSVAGWGATTPAGQKFPKRFRSGDLVVFPDSACGGGDDFIIGDVVFDGYENDEVDPLTMVCAEGVRAERIVDSCIGDSGGPLIAGRGETARLIGVVSWGPQRCASRFSGVYSRVSAFTTFLRAQGVPFAPTPPDAPLPPLIVDTDVTPTSATISVSSSLQGPPATSFRVSVRDRQGRLSMCTMSATADQAPARCTVTGLRSGRRYTVTAVALIGTVGSEPSEAESIRPVDKPARPRIDYVEVTRGGIAVFGVQALRANGSPFTTKIVMCVPADRGSGLPRRSGEIRDRGIATVTSLRAGADYVCRARVANSVGAQRSSAVTLRAR